MLILKHYQISIINLLNELKNINIDIIIGNHDTYYKNTNEINALQELMTWGNVYSEPKVIEKGGMRMLYLL